MKDHLFFSGREGKTSLFCLSILHLVYFFHPLQGFSLVFFKKQYKSVINVRLFEEDKRMDTKMLSIGRGNYVPRGKVITLLQVDSSPVKRLISDLREANKLIDATRGRKTLSLVLMENGFGVLSTVKPSTLAKNMEDSPEVP